MSSVCLVCVLRASSVCLVCVCVLCVCRVVCVAHTVRMVRAQCVSVGVCVNVCVLCGVCTLVLHAWCVRGVGRARRQLELSCVVIVVDRVLGVGSVVFIVCMA